MAILDIMRYLPLVSAAAWFTLCSFQVYRDRIHTFTEVFFLAGCLTAGFYAVSDFLLFNATTSSFAFGAILASFTFVILSMLFMFLFTLVYVTRMRRLYWSFLVLASALLVLTWMDGIPRESVHQPDSGGLYLYSFQPTIFGLILAYVFFLGVGGIVNLYRVHRIVKATAEGLARRTRALLVIFTTVLTLGFATNGYLGFWPSPSYPPPFSSLLLAVGIATFFALNPGSAQRVSQAIRRYQAQYYSVKAAFLMYRDGTLIGADTLPGESIIDNDLFTATLDVIQNFMTTSFPALRGWLRSIRHGDYTILLERGRWTYFVAVIGGEETDQLRRQMRDALLEFETTNRETLAHWRGVPSDAEGTNATLLSLFRA